LLKNCHKVKKEFINWNKIVFGQTKDRISAIEEKIKVLQELPPSPENIEMKAALNLELNEWLEKEELKWKQKSRELWLKEGDQNSKFFHLSTLVRRRCNSIVEIKLDNVEWIHSRDKIERYFTA
jgi:predicted XRE-type DNA-binding protein